MHQDKLKTAPVTREYAKGWDRIFKTRQPCRGADRNPGSLKTKDLTNGRN